MSVAGEPGDAADHGKPGETTTRWREVLAKAKYQDSIITLISKPAEKTKPWKDYRPIFMTDKRITDGRAFLAEHKAALTAV